MTVRRTVRSPAARRIGSGRAWATAWLPGAASPGRERLGSAGPARGPSPWPITWSGAPACSCWWSGSCMMLSVSSVAALFRGRTSSTISGSRGSRRWSAWCSLVVLSRIDYRRLEAAGAARAGARPRAPADRARPRDGLEVDGAGELDPAGSVLTFQPSEFAKLAVVAVAAGLLSAPRAWASARVASYMPLAARSRDVMCLVVLAEGDLGTAIIIAGLMLGMLWVAGMKAAGCGRPSPLVGGAVAVVSDRDQPLPLRAIPGLS